MLDPGYGYETTEQNYEFTCRPALIYCSPPTPS